MFPGLPYLNFLLFKPFFDFQCSFESLERSFNFEAYIASYVKELVNALPSLKAKFLKQTAYYFDIISCMILCNSVLYAGRLLCKTLKSFHFIIIYNFFFQ